MATVVVHSLEAFMSPPVQRDGKPVKKLKTQSTRIELRPLLFGPN
jgi:hypothetical protein